MGYLIARNGTTYGPYSEAQLRAYAATGYVFPSDIARTASMQEWLPIGAVVPDLFPRAAATRFPNPPDMPWWLALLLDLITGTAFFVVWDIVESEWLHRVRPQSRALTYYAIAAVLFLVTLPSNYHSVMHALFNGPVVDTPFAGTLALAGVAVRLLARFSMRRSLLEHFNRTEPLGLHLSWLMTFFFGGLYFQYHFNRLNAMKRALAAMPFRA